MAEFHFKQIETKLLANDFHSDYLLRAQMSNMYDNRHNRNESCITFTFLTKILPNLYDNKHSFFALF